MSTLERRYRLLLRLLPAWYRREREEEMVALFLEDRGRGDGPDDLDLEYGRPGWGEAGATAALAVRTRFAADRATGHAARLVGMAGLLGHLVLAAQGLAAAARLGEGWAAPWLDALALVAFAALPLGRFAVGRAAAWVSCAVVAAAAVQGPPAMAVLFGVPALVTAVAVGVGFHREAPPPPRAGWCRAGALGVA
ncbi:hypothetical protein AB0G50_35800, partial [Actinosynnema sp. NPDC020468]